MFRTYKDSQELRSAIVGSRLRCLYDIGAELTVNDFYEALDYEPQRGLVKIYNNTGVVVWYDLSFFDF